MAVGQLVGGEAVRAKLLRGWQTSGVLASVLLVINYFAFISPPPDVSGLALATPSTLRAHFWLAGLATIAAMFSLVLAVLLSMQMNLLPREEDVFYFLQHYGTWLFGSPTVMVVVALVCTGGQLVSSSALHYPSMESDTWCLLAVVVLFSLGGSWLFVSTSSTNKVLRSSFLVDVRTEHALTPTMVCINSLNVFVQTRTAGNAQVSTPYP